MSGRGSGGIAIQQVAESIAADFDAIASLQGGRAEGHAPVSWNHNDYYHHMLLAMLPDRIESALDIGCGSGGFSRALAGRCETIVGVDLSNEMIRNARSQSRLHPNLRFRRANFLTAQLRESHYDCIVSIATLHHMPIDVSLRKVTRLLRPGGVFVALDLYAERSAIDYATGALAIPINLAMRRYHTGRWQEDAAFAAAWRHHTRNDYFLELGRIRRRAAEIMPGANLRRHLFWRYSIIWKKPGD